MRLDGSTRPLLLNPLFAEIRRLPRVGPRLERQLAKLLGRDPPRRFDLLALRPLARQALVQPDGTAALEEGALTRLIVTIGAHQPSPVGRRPYRIAAASAAGDLELAFFNARAGYLEQRFPVGARMTIIGRPRRYGGRLQIAHPEPDDGGEPAPGADNEPDGGAAGADAHDPGVRLVYPLVHKLTQRQLRRLMGEALQGLPVLPEWLEPSLVSRHRLPPWDEALRTLHAPVGEDKAEVARRRLARDELLATQLALRLVRRTSLRRSGRVLASSGEFRRRLLQMLPFSLTTAQGRAIEEIRGDLARSEPMNRLLMGDVGSGKTLVALMAMLEAVEAGTQAALMAPTEVLARQHAATLGRLALKLGLSVRLVIGGTGECERRAARAAIAEGASAIVVGTHALFQEQVSFRALGLVVIDEQHRFGVHQRLALVAKGPAPHLLLMTATPIPRSLVLSHYGDIATSRLDERPPGRPPVATRTVPRSRLEEVVAAVGRALEQGQRIYWICAAIGEPGSEDEDAAEGEALPTAEQRHTLLRERFGAAVGIVHGRMSGAAKDRVMVDFTKGAIAILVATTVVEVGIDVPEASVMVIDSAERFGLAQLHQLRGRIGRGERSSTCILLYGRPLGATARRRLAIMRESDDGFVIAEEDLALRGPGEVLGVRQSGLPAMRFADLARDGDLVAEAYEQAALLLSRDPELLESRGRNSRLLLHLFERHEAVRLLSAG